MERAIRVLHCPTTGVGNAQSLARAEREMGLRSVAVSLQREDGLKFSADEKLLRHDERPLELYLKRWRLVWRAWREFDVIHYNFGETIMPWYAPGSKAVGAKYPRAVYEINDLYRRLESMCDLPLLKRAGKGIVVTYQGDDARQGDFCRANYEISPAHEVGEGYYSAETDEEKRLRIARFARYADRVYALNPDLLSVLPPGAEFLPYANVDPREWAPPAGAGSTPPGRLTVLHAPTHRGAKGTRYVLDAVSRLKGQDGIDFEFVLVEGLSRAEARRLYERADLLVDQLLYGWYGGLAVECMALAKPVICYLRQEDLGRLPPGMREELPLINATPATVYEVLKRCLTSRRGELPEIGRRSRRYVERWHDPLKIAARLKGEYESILARGRRGAVAAPALL